jgi:hypothetical protein
LVFKIVICPAHILFEPIDVIEGTAGIETTLPVPTRLLPFEFFEVIEI